MNPEFLRSLMSKPISRREFLEGTRKLVVGVAATEAANKLGLFLPGVASAESNSSNLTQILKDYGSKLGVDAVGLRISNGWYSFEGFGYMAYQGAILQYDPNNKKVNLWNTLDQMHELGLDEKLDTGSLGVTIPPHEDVNDLSGGNLEVAFQNRIKCFGVPENVALWVNNFRQKFETGVFTSKGKDYGSYTVYRLQRMAVQVWHDSGLIQRVLVGDAAKAAGFIPGEALLPAPEKDQAPAPEQPQLIRPWQERINYSYWFPFRSAAEGNSHAQGQPDIFEVARYHDSIAASLGKRTYLYQQVRESVDWYFKTATVPQIYLDTAGLCTAVANASVSGVSEPFDGAIGRIKKIGVAALQHSAIKKYKPGRDPLIEGSVKNGTPFILATSNPREGSWTRVALEVDQSRGTVWFSDFGRVPIAVRINDIKDEDVYIPVPSGRERYYPADKVFPAAMSEEYVRRFTFNVDEEVANHIYSL